MERGFTEADGGNSSAGSALLHEPQAGRLDGKSIQRRGRSHKGTRQSQKALTPQPARAVPIKKCSAIGPKAANPKDANSIPLLEETATQLMRDPGVFTREVCDRILRGYQSGVAQAIIKSVTCRSGLSFVILFPRQSGKNELQAHIETFLLVLFSEQNEPAEIVKISPTWKPQSLNAMHRLESVLKKCWLAGVSWQKEAGYIYHIGGARIHFLSGSPETNIVGATASLLLEVDEAQDIQIAKFDRDIAPMAASTNATRAFWGTAWTGNTLLARELRAARQAEERDGIPRVFKISANEVAREVPAYGLFVDGQVKRLGRTHPMVRTQYFSEEIGAEGGMFPPQRVALMLGSHAPMTAPAQGRAGAVYVFLIDAAGEDESASSSGSFGIKDGALSLLSNPRRDSTALTIVEVDSSTLADETLHAPTYRVLNRFLWTGVKQTALYVQIRAMAQSWNPRHIVIDATGVGAGLASFLEAALPGRVEPFIFSSASKSKLGWDFLSICDTGRWREYREPLQGTKYVMGRWGEMENRRNAETSPVHPLFHSPDHPISVSAFDLQSLFFQQLSLCQYAVQEGAGKVMRWSVPDGTHDPATGELVHDDLVISAALVAVLEKLNFAPSGMTYIVGAEDPLDRMEEEF